jgi:shikimate kinase/3-dehydroquinate synthase
LTAPDDRAIAFVGFMGAGKSAAARVTAAALGTEAADADEAIESEAGRPITEIFEAEGEAGFREREARAARDLLSRGGVVSLGGGAVETPAVRDALSDHVVVWCDVEREVAWERVSRNDKRPLGRDRGEFDRRFDARLPLYEEVATATLPSTARDSARLAAPWLVALRDRPGLRLAWARTRSAQYPAVVGEGATLLLGDGEGAPLPGRWFALADRAALAAHPALLPSSEAAFELAGGEESKSLTEAERVLRLLADAGARRDDGVIAFGGGVIGDLAGFCAATYQRGVPVVQMPTTLVAQVDSAYGGKTGVDLPEGKNYVGAYHQPLAVLADPATLRTLPPEEASAGFAEVVKTALIAGGALWERVRELPSTPLAELDRGTLEDVVFACARTKLAVVAEDERDAGRRAVLNLGHTVGHAIEAATSYSRYRHGEAVALGLLAALRLSGAGELRSEVAELLARHGLPTSLDPAVDTDSVLGAVSRDKKATAEGVGFVLAEAPGDVRTGQRVADDDVRAAVEELRENQGR